MNISCSVAKSYSHGRGICINREHVMIMCVSLSVICERNIGLSTCIDELTTFKMVIALDSFLSNSLI